MLFSSALKAQIIKEFLSMLRDKKTRIILVAPPLLQLIIFSYAITLDVTDVDVTLLDRDNGYYSQQFIAQLDHANFIKNIVSVHSYRQLQQQMDLRKSLIAVVIPGDFSKSVAKGDNPQIQLLADGRRANAAQVVTGYIQTISEDFLATVNTRRAAANSLALRHWFNSNLNYQWFVVPSLSGVLSMVTALLLTGLSIARERELGTFDQLLVSPCSAAEIIAAKVIAPLVVGFLLGNLMIAAGVFLFKIPFNGSFWWLQLALLVFLISVAAMGLMISAISNTQQQAILGCFSVVVPLLLMSGFATPVANMPQMLQYIAQWLPIQHYLVIAQGVFMKALPAQEIIAHTVPMAIAALISLVIATLLVRTKLQ